MRSPLKKVKSPRKVSTKKSTKKGSVKRVTRKVSTKKSPRKVSIKKSPRKVSTKKSTKKGSVKRVNKKSPRKTSAKRNTVKAKYFRDNEDVQQPEQERVEELVQAYRRTKDTMKNCQPPKRWTSANKAQGIPKGFCEEPFDGEIAQQEQVPEPVPVVEQVLGNYRRTKDTMKNCQPPKRWTSANKAQGIPKGFCEEPFDGEIAQQEQAPVQEPEQVQEPANENMEGWIRTKDTMKNCLPPKQWVKGTKANPGYCKSPVANEAQQLVNEIINAQYRRTQDKMKDCQPPKRWTKANKAQGIPKGFCEEPFNDEIAHAEIVAGERIQEVLHDLEEQVEEIRERAQEQPAEQEREQEQD